MNQVSYGCGIEVIILPIFYIWFLMVIAIFFTVDKYTKNRVKRPFFLRNIIYDVFFDIGIVLMLVPFFWFGSDCVITVKNLIPLFGSFCFYPRNEVVPVVSGEKYIKNFA